MTNLEIVKSTYEGKTSEENGRNLAEHVAEDISWTEAKGFPYGGTYIGLENITKNVFSRLGSEWTDYKFTPQDYVASGNTVVAYGHLHRYLQSHGPVNGDQGSPPLEIKRRQDHQL